MRLMSRGNNAPWAPLSCEYVRYISPYIIIIIIIERGNRVADLYHRSNIETNLRLHFKWSYLSPPYTLLVLRKKTDGIYE